MSFHLMQSADFKRAFRRFARAVAAVSAVFPLHGASAPQEIRFERVWEGRSILDASLPFPEGVTFVPGAEYRAEVKRLPAGMRVENAAGETLARFAAPTNVALPFTMHVAVTGANSPAVFATKDGNTSLAYLTNFPRGFDARRREHLRSLSVKPDGGAGTVEARLSPGVGQADVRFVTRGREGRPYIEDGRLYFTFSARFYASVTGVGSLDAEHPERGVRFEGVILYDYGDGFLRNDLAPHVFFDDEAGEWRGWACNFSTGSDKLGGRAKGGVNAVWSKTPPLHGLSVMKAKSLGLESMHEDPCCVWDPEARKWRMFVCRFVKGIKGVMMESDRWDGGFRDIAGPVPHDSTGTTIAWSGGKRYCLSGSSDLAYYVYSYPGLEMLGRIDMDPTPWGGASGRPHGRGWPAFAELPDGYPHKCILLTMDRENFPGMPKPNWTYGGLHIYVPRTADAEPRVPPATARDAAPVVHGVAKAEYLDLVQAAVAAYSDDRIRDYIAEVERVGVQEHGFPRLTANLGGLIASGRMRERAGLFRRMMDLACREAKKGPMAHVGGGNEFSVKELVGAILDLERAGVFPKEVTDGWRRDISGVNAWRCYRAKPKVGNEKRSYNWAIFGAASEQTRIHAGMGGDPAFVEKYVSDQMRWFDGNGQWRDPHEPLVYDFVTRLQFAQVLASGYGGPSRAALEAHLERGAAATLALQSACGEIPYGGRSNQFLHNDTFYAALCEWYAARFRERGDLATASRFRSAASRAVAGLRRWLAERPVRHVKNLYATGSGKPGTGIGCESYAYFDKYMATMGSWAMMAMRFADDRPVPGAPEDEVVAFASSPYFHVVALKAGDYSAQFDYNADPHYDCDGLGRIHRLGAPTAICLSVPCAKKPAYNTERQNKRTLAIAPVGGGKLAPAGCGRDRDGAWANWRQGAFDWRCRLSKDGLLSELAGEGNVALSLPAFEFDGRDRTEISCQGDTLVVRYRGWRCVYKTDGEIVDTGVSCCNRNGRYRVFEARGENRLRVGVELDMIEAIAKPRS